MVKILILFLFISETIVNYMTQNQKHQSSYHSILLNFQLMVREKWWDIFHLLLNLKNQNISLTPILADNHLQMGRMRQLTKIEGYLLRNDPLLIFTTQCEYIYQIQILTDILNLLILMEDKKVLGEFAAKISKAKILYDNTSATVQKLRREAAQLQKEYENLANQRKSAEAMEKSLKEQLEHTKQLNKEQHEKCNRQTKHLNDLRKNKKELKRQKDIAENQLLKNTLQLEELIQEREKLQATAKSLSDKLEGVTSEKEALIQEYNKTNNAIQKYNTNINNLKAEIHEMRNVISTNTVPVFNEESVNQKQ